MIKGKFVRMICQKQVAFDCWSRGSHEEIDYICNTFAECYQKAKNDGWDMKLEICPACLEWLKINKGEDE